MITRNYLLVINITLIDQLLVKITFMDLFLITTTLISWQLEDFPYGSVGAVFGGKYYSDWLVAGKDYPYWSFGGKDYPY